MTTIKMTQRTICVACKNRNCRILIARRVFAAQIVFESAFARTQQTQPVPSAGSRVRSQRGRGSGSDYGPVNILGEMMSDSIDAVDPRSTHRTGACLLLSIHELIDH